jgi:PAS domain S-box-containing protein
MPTVDSGLRRRAEDFLDTKTPEAVLPKKYGETLRLLHELQVHHVELQMQNEELHIARNELETALHKYTDLYDFAPVGYFTLDSRGVINSVNLRGASLVGIARARLLGKCFGLLVADEYLQIFTDFLGTVFINPDKTACEVALRNEKNHQIIVSLEAMVAVSGQECGLVLKDITERKQAEYDLRSYASRLIEMEEELRNNLATELHDEICRDLTVLGMNLAIIGDSMKEVAPKKITSRVKVSGRLVKDISHTVRNIMVGLRPPVLNDYGLLAALRWHADLFFKRTGIAVDIQVEEPFPRLAVEMEIALFRISQEALMNTAKHASTQLVIIKLKRADNMIWFAVADEGNGFLPAATSLNLNGAGWGMRIMRERAELVGGHFNVDSVPGKGTTISVVMHLGDM